MKPKYFLLFAILAGLVFLSYLSLRPPAGKLREFTPAENVEDDQASIPSENLSQPPSETPASPKIVHEDNSVAVQGPIALSSNNFESFVAKCFQGEACKFAEDPRKMYDTFKRAGNRSATDSLISFLRSRMLDKGDRVRFKDALKMMIDDFYPPEEKQFQEAAYYNYLGDLNKSLALYLDLEKRALKDPTLRGAPSLNIANTFYDLGRKQEALAYYKMAQADYESGKTNGGVAGTNEMLRFIDGRINEIADASGSL